MSWIAIFKPGTHTDAGGNTVTYTEDDVKNMATAYNEQSDEDRHDAPLVKGHPATDDPALGWVDKLKYEGGKLWAKLKDVKEEVVKEVKEGAYKKVSVRLYSDNRLRHVGLLGATPPAIKGLGDVNFSEFISTEFNNEMDFAFADSEKLKEAQQKRSKKYSISIKDKFGIIQKPEYHKELTDDDFADPVHYRFPIHDEANLLATERMFSFYDETYTEIEKQIILSRILSKKIVLGLDTKINYYSENNFFQNNKGDNMPNNKYLKFRDAFIEKLKEQTSDDVATRAAAIFTEELSEKTFNAFSELAPEYFTAPVVKDDKDDDDKGNSYEESDAYKQQQREIQELREENRKHAFNDFLNTTNLIGVQKTKALPVLEIAYRKDNKVDIPFTYAEGDKSSVDVVKDFIKTIPAQGLLEEESNGSNYAEDDDLKKQDAFIEQFNKEIR